MTSGQLPLHDCIKSGNLNKLTKLLDGGWPVDERNKNGQTPLFIGASTGHTEMVKALIRHGADVNVRDNCGWTPLLISVCSGNNKTVKLLLQHGAQVNLKNDREETPLHWAATYYNTEAVKLLLQHGAEVNVKDNDKQTPLHYAATRDKEAVKLLLQHGAEVNVKDNDKQTPLHYAATRDKEKVKLLLQYGADIDAVDRFGRTPIMYAESGGQIEAVYILRQFKPVQDLNKKFLSSTHDVSTHSSRSTKVKCSTNVTPKDEPVGKTVKERKLPLHDCIRDGDLDKLTKLVEDGWPVDLRDDDGWSPLCIVSWLGNTEAVKLLISHGADVNVKDKHGWTPLHYLAYHGHKEMANVLISHAVDVNAKDNVGETPLYKTTWEGHTEIVELLISNGADVNVKEKNGLALLHNRGHHDDPAIFKVLIIHGADVNIQDNNRRTPLHTNAGIGKIEIVKLLIQYGANIDAADCRGYTPLMIANLYGHSDIVDIINQAKSPVRKIKKVFAGLFGYSSRTRQVVVERTDDKGQKTKVKYESSEVSKQVVTKHFETVESVTKGEEDAVKEDKGSQGHTVEELATKSGLQNTTSKIDVCSFPGLSPTPASLAQPSTSSSLPPSSSPPPSSLSPPPPSSSSSSSSPSLTSSQPASSSPPLQLPAREKVSWHVQEIWKTVNEGKSGEDQDTLSFLSDHLGGNVIVIQQKTENHYHYPTCHCNNKQDTGEKVKVEKSKTLNVSVGGTRYGLLHPPQGDDHEKGDENEYAYETGEDIDTGGEGRDEQPVGIDMSDKSNAGILAQAAIQSSSPITATTPSASKTTGTSATEIRRRLESQAGYMEKMVQSCVAGGGVCQDQSSDLAPLHHGCTHVPVKFNFFVQPHHVEVLNTKQVNCKTAEVEKAEMMPVNSTCNFNYAAQTLSDDDGEEENTDDGNSEDSKEIHEEEDNGSDFN